MGPLITSKTLQQSVDFQKIVLEDGFDEQYGLKLVMDQCQIDSDFQALLEQMLCCDPDERISCERLLETGLVKAGALLGGVVGEYIETMGMNDLECE